MLGLASELRFQKGDKRFYSGSSESTHKKKPSYSKDWQKLGRFYMCVWVCRKVDESIDHIVSSCSEVTQKE